MRREAPGRKRWSAVCAVLTLCMGMLPGLMWPGGAAAARPADEPVSQVVLGIDTSGSMGYLGEEGHARVLEYVTQVLFQGFELGDVQAPDTIIVPQVVATMPEADRTALAQGLAAAGGGVEAFWYGVGITEEGTVADASGLAGIYPAIDQFDGGTHLGDALARALAGFDAQPMLQSVYWVNVSDDILDVGDPSMDADQRKMILQLRDAYPSRVLLSISVEQNDRTVLVNVEEFYSKSQIASTRQMIADTLPQVEGQAQDPQVSSAELRTDVSALRDQVTALEGTLAEIGTQVYGSELAEVRQELEEMNQRVAALETLLAVPAAFDLLTPEAGAQAAAGEVRLSWQPSEAATRYEVAIQAGDGEPTVATVDAGQTEYAATLAAGAYRWRVQAVGARDDLITENDGGWRDLTVGEAAVAEAATATNTPEPTEEASPAFGPVAPLEGRSAATGEVRFEWGPAAGASSYTLTVAPLRADAEEGVTLTGPTCAMTVPLDTGVYSWTVTAADAAGNTWTMDGAPVRFVVKPEGSGGSFPWGILLLLLVVVGAVLAWVRLRRPIRVELSTLTGTTRPQEFSLGVGRADGRIYLQRRDDDKPYYDVGVPEAYLERTLTGVHFHHSEGDKGEAVPWDSYYEIARSEYDTVTIEMRRAAKPSEAEEEGDNYP